MNRIRPILLVIVVINAMVALVLWMNAIPMPTWFAVVLVLVSLTLVFSRVIERHFSQKPRAS